MKIQSVLNRYVRRSFTALIGLLLIFLLSTHQVGACSWDYPIWMIRSKNADPLYRFVKDGKAGYINRSGKVVIKPQFNVYGNSGDAFQNGLLQLSVSDARYVDTTGRLVIDKAYSSAWDFSDGLAAVLPETGGKWGYIDNTGEFAISPRFEGYPNGYVDSFSEGLAMIKVAGKYGYVGRTGEFAIRPTFLFGTAFQDGMARVVVEGPCSYFDFAPCAGGTLLGEPNGRPVSACKFTFIDKSGSIISTKGYDDAKDFGEGLAPVMLGDKWGYIDKNGQIVIEPKFDDAEIFSDGLARVKQGDLLGYIDRTGKLAIGLQFDYAEDFSDGLAVVGRRIEESEPHDYYYINKHGVQSFKEEFILASTFFKGLAHVKLKSPKQICECDESSEEGAFAYIDVTGKKIFTYCNCNTEE